MIPEKKTWTKAAIMLAVAGLMIMGIMSFAALAEEKKVKPTWVWTKERPKPSWWRWDGVYSKDKPVRGGYLHVASSRYVGMMNPNHWPINDWATIINFYEGRVAYDGTYRQRHPWLVDKWTYVAPNVVDEHYRPGVYFSDGTEVTAEGVVYLFNWIKDKKNGCWSRGTTKKYKKVEVIDKYTARFTTKEPWGNYPVGWFGFIISAKALKGDVALRDIKIAEKNIRKAKKDLAKLEKKVEKTEKNANKIEKLKKKIAANEAKIEGLKKQAAGHISTDLMPVGTGPFILEKASSGNFVKMKRNPNWWFGQSIDKPEMPYLDGILNTVIPDPSIQIANLRAGKIDQMGVSKSQYDIIKKDRNLNVYAYLDNHTVQLALNHQSKALSDIRVRKAVSHAIDRKALIAGTEFGLAREASCMYPGDHWAHNPGLQPVKYDPELSKRLLKEAGYGDGLTLKGYAGNSPAANARSVAIKNMLAKVGINWKVEALSPAAIDDRVKNLEYDLGLIRMYYIQDPTAVAENFYKSKGRFNMGRYENPELDKLIDAGRIEISEAKRQKMYYQIEKTLYENYVDIWLWWEMSVVARRKQLQGYNHDMFMTGRTHYLYSHPLWFKDGHR
ncbi:MAG: hypothetical protein JRG97_01800 [Deltaproteobacteria bacterium]|nr:hypothetical protein [Deltaproteobacteria bacterium]MBW2050726.1 hypothetical protein [Deltaproteobacteria bacterium]MBW2139789.1 hypothetical protein [Deltaproteobacteria bacterium]MBW2322769.1 hypothetical protein [Deltaproteobacteria bacterium]